MADTSLVRRLWRHWNSSAAHGRKLFPPASLAALGAAIHAGEQTHRGELRLVVEAALPSELVWDGVSNRQRALALFAELGVWDTEDNCGVLLYVNLAERKVDIVADRAIHRKLGDAAWRTVCDAMTSAYARGQFHEGTLAAVQQVNALLQQHFPSAGARPNELPDHPILL